MAETVKLYTAAGETLPTVPHHVYPRPQLRRESFLCLNGEWEFCVTKGEEPTAYDRRITVPFCPESLLSGVDACFLEEDVLWYRRTFTLPQGFLNERVLLHFGAVDQIATVWVNGIPVCEHTGGYQPFYADITDCLQTENTVVVRATDHLTEYVLPYGKQCAHRGGMWYTPVSGIWQTVWLESVPTEYIRSLKIDVTATAATVAVQGATEGTVTVQTEAGELCVPLTDGAAEITLPQPHPWSPEDPYLYAFTVQTATDRVESYFALRTLTVETVDGYPRLCLNGKPYFFHALLDQGYWSDGLFTPASSDGFAEDILAMKGLGFNTLRKHIKIEPEQFYYDCDRLGMVVFQDMVNNGRYSFFRDTALPTAGMLRFPDRLLHRDRATRAAFEEAMVQTVEGLYNHPCICYWTIFNEGWGQFDSTAMYRRLRQLDTSRFIDTASGWFAGGETEVDSRHIYFRKVKLKAGKKPLVLSEFGGYSWKPTGHVFNTEQTYGYAKYEKREEFVRAVQALYRDEILPLIPQGLCAAVYTQVSDVEDETNGLVSYDRRVQKLLPEEFAALSAQLCAAIQGE